MGRLFYSHPRGFLINNFQIFLAVCFVGFLLWSIAHTEAGQVAITEGKQNHKGDKVAIVLEVDWQMEARLNVTQHKERNEEHPSHNEEGEDQAVSTWLQREKCHELIENQSGRQLVTDQVID